MKIKNTNVVGPVIGHIPYRLALPGGWIDQPFLSQHLPKPPGSMVVVCVEPNFSFMERAGIATGTSSVATKLWKGRLPKGQPADLVRKLYDTENLGRANPSGSQDMIGLIYPGINRLDYDHAVHGGIFPAHVESLNDVRTTHWLEKVIHILPVAARPAGYDPLIKININARWIGRLGQTGKDCFTAIKQRDLAALGASFNECMKCWEALLPGTVRHPTITTDLTGLLHAYQRHYAGAMYSGCGGGYLFVASEKPVPGAFQINVRLAKS